MKRTEILPGVHLLELEGRRSIATLAAAPGSVYGERTIENYRIWDPYRSKLAALLIRSQLSSSLALSRDTKILYLGAATGTTASHLSDIASNGLVYTVEISPRAMRQLLILCEARHNLIPILADARKPETYAALLEPVDMVYQDVAQRNQAEIAILNSAIYLRPNGLLILMIKTRSIDSAASAKDVYCREAEKLKGMAFLFATDLLPYHQDHWAVVARKD